MVYNCHCFLNCTAHCAKVLYYSTILFEYITQHCKTLYLNPTSRMLGSDVSGTVVLTRAHTLGLPGSFFPAFRPLELGSDTSTLHQQWETFEGDRSSDLMISWVRNPGRVPDAWCVMHDACFALVWFVLDAAAKCATDAALLNAFHSFLPYNVIHPSIMMLSLMKNRYNPELR